VKEASPARFAGWEARKGSGSFRVDGERHLAARPGSAEEMPGTTHPRRSSDDDERCRSAVASGEIVKSA
jgi:hypothetical protein